MGRESSRTSRKPLGRRRGSALRCNTNYKTGYTCALQGVRYENDVTLFEKTMDANKWTHSKQMADAPA